MAEKPDAPLRHDSGSAGEDRANELPKAGDGESGETVTRIVDIPTVKSDFVGVYLLKSKTFSETKAGAPYLRLRLSDCTGEIDAFVWENVGSTDSAISQGQVIKLKGRLNIFQQRPNVKVLHIRSALDNEYDVSEIVDSPKTHLDDLLAVVTESIERVADPDYRALLEKIFSDKKFVARFKTAPGAKAIHHAYPGGLLEHTVSLLRLASSVLEIYGDLDADLLITSCILHDIGKMDEYNSDLAVERTTEGRLLGHIVLGLLQLQRYVEKFDSFPSEKWRKLLHALISHHGSLEWGSPQVPMTLEAIALHYIDNLDAKLGQFRALVEKHKDPNFKGFTTYDRFLERWVYFGDSAGKTGDERK